MIRCKNILNLFFSAGLILLCSSTLFAQKVSISASADTIGFNETVTITVSGTFTSKSYIDPPKCDGFTVIGHSNQEYFSGSYSQIPFTITYELMPRRSGTFVIGPACLVTGSKKRFSNTVTVYVKPLSLGAVNENSFLLRCEPSAKKVYIGQQVALNLFYYMNRPAEIDWSNTEPPVTSLINGCIYQRPDSWLPSQKKDTTVYYDGVKYRGIPVFRDFIYPSQTGKLTIPEYRFNIKVSSPTIITGDDFIDMQSAFMTPVELHSRPVTIDVLPLPDEGKPADFTGDVGKFALGASIDKSSLKTNEAVKLTVTISGNGNVSFVRLHDLIFPDGIQSFVPETTDSSKVTVDGMTGQKTFTFTLIPEKAGSYTIPPVTYSYFDPEKEKYVTLQTEEFHIDVQPGIAVSEQSENNLPGSFLAGKSQWRILRNILLILILPTALFVFLVLRKTKKDKAKEAAEQLRVQKEKEETANFAQQEANLPKTKISQQLQRADSFIQQRNIHAVIPAFYEMLMLALCEKCELAREESSASQLRYRLGVKGFSSAETEEILSFTEWLSGLRFTYSGISPEELLEIRANTLKMTSKLGF